MAGSLTWLGHAAFRLDTENYPDSANAWDSLGEGLERAGRLAAAADAYGKALALAETAKDPRLETFRSHAQRLADRMKTGAK